MFVHCSYEKLSRLYIVVMRSYHACTLQLQNATMYSKNATMYSKNAAMYSENATMYSATMQPNVLKSNMLEMKIIRRIKKITCFFLENLKKQPMREKK